MSVAIELQGLTKTHRGRTVVDDLTFRVAPGRITGFLGANGAGRTTTLRMLLGLVSPDAGSATIDGGATATCPIRWEPSVPCSTRTATTTGIRWLRDLLRDRAGAGIAVLISSHLLAELEGTVDDDVVIGQGRLPAAGPIGQVTDGRSLGTTYLALTTPMAGIH